MNIQPPQDNNGPAYPSRAGIAALAAACMLGTIPSVFSAEPRVIPQGTLPVSPDTSQSAAGEAFDREWSREVKDQNLYVKQQAEQDALLGAYADGKTPVPDETMARLQEMILNHARQRQDIRKNPENKNGDGAMRWAYVKGEFVTEPGKSHQQSYEEKSMLQRQFREEERLFGKYMNADEAMPSEKLANAAAMMLRHVSERKALRLKYAPVEVVSEQPVQSVALDRPHVKGLVVLDTQTGQPMTMERTSFRDGGREELRSANAVPLSDEEMTQQLQNAYDAARSALYLQQQSEEEALLGAYAWNGSSPVSDDTMQQLRNIVLKYATEREALRTKYIYLGQQKDALMRRQKQEWDELQKMQECEVYSDYGKLGAPVYLELDGISVSDQALQGVKAMILQQIRQRAELKRKHRQEQIDLLRTLSDRVDR